MKKYTVCILSVIVLFLVGCEKLKNLDEKTKQRQLEQEQKIYLKKQVKKQTIILGQPAFIGNPPTEGGGRIYYVSLHYNGRVPTTSNVKILKKICGGVTIGSGIVTLSSRQELFVPKGIPFYITSKCSSKITHISANYGEIKLELTGDCWFNIQD